MKLARYENAVEAELPVERFDVETAAQKMHHETVESYVRTLCLAVEAFCLDPRVRVIRITVEKQP